MYIVFCKQVLNCGVEFYNPEDHFFGWVNADGVSGSYKDLVDENVDAVLGCQYTRESRLLVKLTLLKDNLFHFTSPNLNQFCTFPRLRIIPEDCCYM